MGRLTEYIYAGSRQRTTHIDRSETNGDVTVTGAAETVEMLNSLITSNANMERAIRRLIRGALSQARGRVSKDIRAYIKQDPRGSYKAVKHAVYKKVFGGNISILNKRSRGAATAYVKPTSNHTGRGGNRWGRSDRTKQLESYGGSDRGFILRFLNAGTSTRNITTFTNKDGSSEKISRLGNRGSIAPTGLFEHTAPWQMDAAASLVSEAIEELIALKANG